MRSTSVCFNSFPDHFLSLYLLVSIVIVSFIFSFPKFPTVYLFDWLQTLPFLISSISFCVYYSGVFQLSSSSFHLSFFLFLSSWLSYPTFSFVFLSSLSFLVYLSSVFPPFPSRFLLSSFTLLVYLSGGFLHFLHLSSVCCTSWQRLQSVALREKRCDFRVKSWPIWWWSLTVSDCRGYNDIALSHCL